MERQNGQPGPLLGAAHRQRDAAVERFQRAE
jgi:hypothetical protein